MSAARNLFRGRSPRAAVWRGWLLCAGFALVLAGRAPPATAISRLFLYAGIAHGSTVVKVDPDSGDIVATIGIPGEATDIAAAPDGSEVYVAIAGGGNGVSVIDTVTNTVRAAITLDSPPGELAVSPDGNWLYVSLPAQAAVTVIGTYDRRAHVQVPVGPSPSGLAVGPNGSRVYVAGAQGFVVAAAAQRPGEMPVPLTLAATRLVVSPPVATSFGDFVYASGGDEHNFDPSNLSDYFPPFTGSVLDVSYAGVAAVAVGPGGARAYFGGTEGFDGDSQAVVYVVDTATNAVVNSIYLYACDGPVQHLVTSSNGQRLFASDTFGFVLAIDPITGATGNVISASCDASDRDLAITEDGTRLFVGGVGCDVQVIDAATHAQLATIPVSTSALAVANVPAFTEPASASGCAIDSAAGGNLPLVGLPAWLWWRRRRARPTLFTS